MEILSDEAVATQKKFFNDHAEKWLDMWYKNSETGKYDKHEKAFARLFSLMKLKPGDTVLDAGCGTGVMAPYILERITEDGILYEADYAEKMIEHNRKLHPQKNIRFITADVANIALADNTCDSVICFSCFPHFRDKAQTMATLARILKPGGLLAVSHFASSDEINKHHENCGAVKRDRLAGEAEMRRLFEAAGLIIDIFIDEPGFYCITSKLPE